MKKKSPGYPDLYLRHRTSNQIHDSITPCDPPILGVGDIVMPNYDQQQFSLDVTDADDIELIEMFLEDLPSRIDSLNSAADAGDFSCLNRLAHQLKGAAPGFGFDPIGSAAAVLEERLKTSNLEMVELDQIREEFDTLLTECGSYLKYIDN